MKHTFLLLLLATALLSGACKGGKNASDKTESDTVALVAAPEFRADSAMEFARRQCEFGPRTMNSVAHDRCGDYIVGEFKRFGAEVVEQRATVIGYDGTPLMMRNIVASFNVDNPNRIMFCGHWDSRPWADNDPDEGNHHKPVLAANDAASDVAVMLEMARLIGLVTPELGVDFICFDAEDYGTPQWADHSGDTSDTWCLGSQYWASNLHREGYAPRYGILMDMVGGKGATFYQEQVSNHFASDVVRRVWQTASALGYGSYFPNEKGGAITDDHLPVNQIARIPCIDVVPYYPECEQSNFGPTWHTVSDTMENLDPAVLKAVGQTMVQVLYNEK